MAKKAEEAEEKIKDFPGVKPNPLNPQTRRDMTNMLANEGTNDKS